jgi:hypothetical protein
MYYLPRAAFAVRPFAQGARPYRAWGRRATRTAEARAPGEHAASAACYASQSEGTGALVVATPSAERPGNATRLCRSQWSPDLRLCECRLASTYPVASPTEARLSAFLRSFAGILARKITGARKGRPLQAGRFWSALAWSRVITWGREYSTVRRYIFRNRIEGAHGPAARRALEHGPSG